MAIKLTSKQQAQLAYLERLPPKFGRVKAVVDQMGSGSQDETLVRGMIRHLDEIKAGSSQLSMNALAEAAGAMAAIARRGGGQQVKVRGLMDAMASVKVNYDKALTKAQTEEPEQPGGGT